MGLISDINCIANDKHILNVTTEPRSAIVRPLSCIRLIHQVPKCFHLEFGHNSHHKKGHSYGPII